MILLMVIIAQLILPVDLIIAEEQGETIEEVELSQEEIEKDIEDKTEEDQIDLGENVSRKDVGGQEVVELGDEELEEAEIVDTTQVLSGEVSGGRDLNDIFADFKLTIKYGNKTYGDNEIGEEIKSEDKIEVKENDEIVLSVDWKMSDKLELKDGDKAIYQLPENYPINKEIKNREIPFKGRVDGAELEIGHFKVDDNNRLTLIFNDKLVGVDSREGTFRVSSKISESLFEDNILKEIVFEYPISKSYILKYGFNKDGATDISKAVEADNKNQPKKLTWTIDLNKGMKDIEDVKIEDVFEQGLNLERKDVKIYELNIGLDGQIKSIGNQVFQGKTNFPLELGNIDRAYRIVYTTDVEDEIKNNPSMDKVENKAILSGSNIEALEAVSSINTKKPVPLNKSGSHTRGNEIDWVIDLNYENDKVILNKGYLIKDRLEDIKSENGDRLAEQEVVSKIEIPGLDESKYSVTIDEDKKGFTIEILEDIDERVYITYTTSYKFLDEKGYGEDYSFFNNVEVKGNKVRTEVPVNRPEMMEKTHQVQSGEYKDGVYSKRIEWGITLNKGKEELKSGTVFKDMVGKGHEIDGDIEIISGSEDVKIEKNGESFTVTLNKNISEPIVLKYYTKIIDFEKGIYNNKIGGLGKDRDVETSTIASTINKENTSIDYSKREAEWKINIKSNSGRFKSLKISDVLGEGHSYIEGSISMVLDGEELGKEDYEVQFGESFNNFELSLTDTGLAKSKGDSQLELTYKTKFGDVAKISSGKLSNEVNTNIETEKRKDKINDKAEIDLKQWVSNNIEKLGKLNKYDRTIDWKIYLNPLENKYGEINLEDEFSEGQELDLNSFSFYEYSIGQDGKGEKGSKIDIKIEPKLIENGFTLKIPSEYAEKRILLEYKTKIVGLTEEAYTNTATVLGAKASAKVNHENHSSYIEKETIGDDTVYIGDEIDWQIEVNKSLSQLNKDDKNIILTDKITDGHRLVENSIVVYQVVEGKKIIEEEFKNLVSYEDSTIEIDFGTLDGKEYLVEYKTIVTKLGEIKNNASLTGTRVEQDVLSEKILKAEQFIWGTGSGSSRRGKITLNKVDKDKNKLEGAAFNLYKQIDSNWALIKENLEAVEGILEEILQYGKYKFVEVEAPEGYELDNKEHIFTLDGDNIDVSLNIANNKPQRRIEIRKIDENKNILSGAEFTLYDENKKEIASITSDKDGKINFENLERGIYYVKETKAPKGYTLNEKEEKIIFSGEYNENQSFDFINYKTPEDPGKPIDPWDPKEEPKDPEGEIPVDPVNPVDPSEEDETVIDDGKIDKERPKDPDKKNPVDVDDTTGIKSGDIDKDSDKEDNSQIEGKNINKENNKDQLPKTGNVNSYLLVFLGLLIAGFGINLIKREKLGK